MRSELVQTHYRIGFGPLVRTMAIAIAGFLAVFVLITSIMQTLSNATDSSTVALIAALGVTFGWMWWRVKRSAQLYSVAMTHIAAGRYQEATTILDALCMRPPTIPMHAVCIHSRATVYTLTGDFDRAKTMHSWLLEDLAKYPKLLFRAPVDVFRTSIATFYAWANDVDTSLQLLEDVPDSSETATFRTWTRIVLSIRQGDVADALESISGIWEETERAEQPLNFIVLRILRAYCLHRIHAPQTTAESTQILRTLNYEDIARAAWMGTDWPELAQFIEGLCTPPQQDAVEIPEDD